jgi:indolepyruvate decarboxylase
VVIDVGSPLTDFNSGAFTAHLDPQRTIMIGHHRATVGGKRFSNVEMGDLLAALARRLPKRSWPTLEAGSLGPVKGEGEIAIGVDELYPRWAHFLKPDDILIAETGTASMGLGFARMPKGATFHNQTLWGSIGWATPAALGAAVASPHSRVVLVTGDGSHQLTAQEISQFGRLKLTPVVFVLNNNGYLIERLLCKEPAIAYNDIASWNYAELPAALGCRDWLTARVETCGEFDQALAAAATAKTGVYIEVVTDAHAASPLAMKLHDAVKTLYT